MLSDFGNSVTIANISADRSITTTIKDIRLILEGTNTEKMTSGYRRNFTTANIRIEFEGTFSGYVRVSPSNSPTNVYINGTVNMYGIKSSNNI